uniref:DEP domain-containing protein n=1 Tax=Macrostomum lignano TaxID=282301 RepID=A0A1I8IIL6_9PLAT
MSAASSAASATAAAPRPRPRPLPRRPPGWPRRNRISLVSNKPARSLSQKMQPRIERHLKQVVHCGNVLHKVAKLGRKDVQCVLQYGFVIGLATSDEVQLLFDRRAHLRQGQLFVDLLVAMHQHDAQLRWHQLAAGQQLHIVPLHDVLNVHRDAGGCGHPDATPSPFGDIVPQAAVRQFCPIPLTHLLRRSRRSKESDPNMTSYEEDCPNGLIAYLKFNTRTGVFDCAIKTAEICLALCQLVESVNWDISNTLSMRDQEDRDQWYCRALPGYPTRPCFFKPRHQIEDDVDRMFRYEWP